MKTIIVFVCVMSLLAWAGPALADISEWITYWQGPKAPPAGGDPNKDWFNENNWTNGVPFYKYEQGETTYYGKGRIMNGETVVIDKPGAECYTLTLGSIDGSTSGHLQLKPGGTLAKRSSPYDCYFTFALYDGTVTQTGGEWGPSCAWLHVSGDNENSSATYEISAGEMEVKLFRINVGGTFHVIGAEATKIRVRHGNGWYQHCAGGTLKTSIGSDGITPINVPEGYNTSPNSNVGATFFDGSLLDPGFAEGVAPHEGTWDLVWAKYGIDDQGLGFAPGVDESKWSFDIVGTAAVPPYGGEGQTLQLTYVPEPASVVLLLSGGVLAMLRRRKQR